MRGTGRQDWYQSDRALAGGGVLIETGSHLIDQVLTILLPSRCDVRSVRTQIFEQVEYDVEVDATLTTDGRDIPFSVQVSKERDTFNGSEFAFDSGFLRLGVMPDTPLTLCDRSGHIVSTFALGTAGATSLYQAFGAEWRAFLALAQGDTSHRQMIHADTALSTTQFIEDCYSAQTESDRTPALGNG